MNSLEKRLFMTKKYINANIYRNAEASEFIIEDGKFKAIGNDLPEADEVIDLEGRLVLPPYVDPHLHLDYIFSGLGEGNARSEEHTSELQSRGHLVCRLLLEKK